MKLTPPQVRVLGEVRLKRVPGSMANTRGERGQAQRTVDTLLERGLIEPRKCTARGPYKLTEAGRQALKDNL